jgi:two-component sensor histidine kinase
MRLVNALSNQLKAELTVHRRKPGTEFLLNIPDRAQSPT